jgi:hypothetical protein
MRVLKEASTSSNLGGGKPNPFVVWAARLDDLLFFPPPLAANGDDLFVCGRAVKVNIGLATANPSTNSITVNDNRMHINAKIKVLD